MLQAQVFILAALFGFATSASASTFSMIYCTSDKGDADISVNLIDQRKTDHAHLYDGLPGQADQFAQSQTFEYSESRFSFSGVTNEKKAVRLEIDLRSSDVKNGALTINGKSQQVVCYESTNLTPQ